MSADAGFCGVPLEPDRLLQTLTTLGGRLLLLGAPGVGKSTFAAQLASELVERQRSCACISADPGSPAFGLPGTLNLGVWRDNAWDTLETEALCTLDGGRFRLPLIDAVRRLVKKTPAGVLLIDAPGVVRGVAGAELAVALAHASNPDAVLCIARDGNAPPLAQELASLTAKVFVSPAAGGAHRPGKRARARTRTRLWDDYLDRAREHRLALDGLALIGTPPPLKADKAWLGRQVALLDTGHRTLGLGEVVGKDATTLTIRTPTPLAGMRTLLIRDAQRMKDGLLATAEAGSPGTVWFTPPPDMLPPEGTSEFGGPRPLVRMGPATLTLVNGIFGDPLLHLRLRHQRRSLLFDLGEAGRLAARVAHQVTDVFISHAHFDHIAGFLWLLRSRIGVSSPCRLFGPPGLSKHILGLIDGIRWDRIGDRGPVFEVGELHDNQLIRYRLQAGQAGAQMVDKRPARQGILLQEAAFRVRALVVDHGIPVLAFAFETAKSLNVRKDRLTAFGLPVGPWLGELKRTLFEERHEAVIELPDGRRERAGILAEQLIGTMPGQKLVYATDLADTPENRLRLTEFAKDADTLFCEAAFMEKDAQQAIRTGHLTARACGEIANAAGVERLVPFHFSRRYQDEPQPLYDEVRRACPHAALPGGIKGGS